MILTMLLACTPGTRPSLQVYAASSLTEAFTALRDTFEDAHPDTDVALAFAGSQILRLQIAQGAPADLFASANPAHVAALVGDGQMEARVEFARNHLVVIVPRSNPAGIVRFADLPRALRLVLGTPDVPVGAYAREVLQRADATLGHGFAASVLSHVVSEESNARLVRAKVVLGEADAAIVYATDAIGVDGLHMVAVPHALDVPATYVAGLVTGTEHRDEAEAWLALLTDDIGQQVLVAHGFTPP